MEAENKQFARNKEENPAKLNPVPRILVLGGNGFIGGRIVELLNQERADVIIGTRNPKTTGASSNEYRRVRLHEKTSTADWIETLQDIDILINAVGILRERKGESFDAVHHRAVRAMATASKDFGIKVIHISALGLQHPLKAPFSVTKKQGEQALIQTGADWHIIRASIVEGAKAYGGNWFKKVANWPIHFIPQKHAKISPVNVDVLAECVKSLAFGNADTRSDKRIHELSDGKNYLLPDYLVTLGGGKKKPRIVIPDFLVRITTWVCDFIGVTPLTYGHYELLTFDNCPRQIEKTL